MSNTKQNKLRKPSILKIGTRIVISSILAIVIPVLIIAVYATYFGSSVYPIFDTSRLTSNSYSTLSQIEWNQTLKKVSNVLLKDTSDERKTMRLEKIISSIEEAGVYFYISDDEGIFYSTDGVGDNILNIASEMINVGSDENVYYFGDNGLVIVNHLSSDDEKFKIVVTVDKYTVPNISQKSETNNPSSTTITVTSLIFFAAIALIFALIILLTSSAVSRSIIKPIKKITQGANEIANGNYDYEIDYNSTNFIGHLSNSFNTMRQKIKDDMQQKEESDMRQKQITAGIAHDLRTPLTSITGYVEGLRDGIADTPEMKKHYLDTIYSSACDTQKMLDDLLMISNYEIGAITLNKETVHIDDIINYAHEIAIDLKQNNFDFEIFDYTKTNPTLSIDTDRFVRVIDNVISNSVKYRRQGVKGKITFTLSEYAHTVIFEMKDNGMGVDKESLPHIFEMSYRADKARSDVHNGSGLGLAVCKEIVELHGGMIWAQSDLGDGLTIFISLPTNE